MAMNTQADWSRGWVTDSRSEWIDFLRDIVGHGQLDWNNYTNRMESMWAVWK